MSIERLENIISPPEHPLECPSMEHWRLVESNFVPLPNDYHDYLKRYGTGAIDSFIWIFNPASANPNLNLANQIERQLDILRETNQTGFEPRMMLFPEQGGVLPFGISDNGDVLLWETKGDADAWTVAVLPSRSSPFIRFSSNMTDFLAGILERSVHCEAFPNDFPNARPKIIQR